MSDTHEKKGVTKALHNIAVALNTTTVVVPEEFNPPIYPHLKSLGVMSAVPFALYHLVDRERGHEHGLMYQRILRECLAQEYPEHVAYFKSMTYWTAARNAEKDGSFDVFVTTNKIDDYVPRFPQKSVSRNLASYLIGAFAYGPSKELDFTVLLTRLLAAQETFLMGMLKSNAADVSIGMSPRERAPRSLKLCRQAELLSDLIRYTYRALPAVKAST